MIWFQIHFYLSLSETLSLNTSTVEHLCQLAINLAHGQLCTEDYGTTRQPEQKGRCGGLRGHVPSVSPGSVL